MKFPIHLHNAISIYTCVRFVKAILTMVMNVRNKSCLSMSQNRATFKTLVIITIHMTCQDDDDDYDSAITPNEPTDSLSMGDEHLNTILATKSYAFIKSSVENLVLNPSESEGENGCDVPACFTTFSNILFEADYESESSDYHSCSDEDFSKEIFLNPLFGEEINSMRIDQHHFNAEFDLIESLLNRDSSIISSSSKIDSLLDELVGKLTLLKLIPSGINETDCYHEENIRLIERLLYDNSSPRPPEEFVFENSNADIESFFPSPIPNEDSDFFMEDIDLSFNPDGLVPPGIEEDDDDSERDMLIHQELLDNYSISLPVIESFYFDISLFSRPPAKPPDGTGNSFTYDTIPESYDEDDDDDYDSAITPNEPTDSLSMGDEHLNMILATESDAFIKSSVENLVPNPSESEGENGCDVPACFTTFSNILFEADYESDSSDYQSCSDEDFSKEIFSNPLFGEEINSMRIDQHHFNAEFNLIESLLNRDSSIISSSSKINSLLDELAGELTLLKLIPSGIDETDCYHEENIRLIERLLYDNSSPRPPEEFVFENSNADIESFFPSPIPNEDSDSFMEDIDLSFNPDGLVSPGIEEDDDDSERDMLIHEELLDNYSISLPVIESFYFDISLFSRPPAKPPDGNTGIWNIKIMGDISDQKVPMPRLMITLASNQEKSHDLLSNRGLEIFKISAKCPMMIHGKNFPTLDVPLFHFYPLDQLKYGEELGQAQ
nr:hypothetical protein [Tanacetum cinerariifolium]